MSSVQFPEGFEDIQPFAEKWARDTEFERASARRNSTPKELKTFYDAVVPHLPAILERVDKYPLGKVEGADHGLFMIALALAEVAPHVEFYKCSPGVPYAFEEVRMKGAHERVAD